MTSTSDRQLLLALARDAITAHVNRSAPPAVPACPAALEHGGAFVTIHKHGELRGCIGHIEANGRIDALTLHVFDRALADAARWHMSGQKLAVAVNVSASLLLDLAFVDTLADRIEAAPVPAAAITIEVTETAAMKAPEVAIAALESWRALGVNISIDDYGTGQSSLGYLQKLPASELKIDMSFVHEIPGGGEAITTAIAAMGHSLGLTVLAEGVETSEQLDFLREVGCDGFQGNLLSAALDVDAATRLLQSRRRLARRETPISTLRIASLLHAFG